MMRNVKALITLIIAISVGVIFGYYSKKPDANMLRIALDKKTEWKKDLFIKSLRSETSLFKLKVSKPFIGEDGNQYFLNYGSFIFNWEAFIFGVIFILSLYVIIVKTTLLSLLKSKVKPYLK